MKNSIDVSSLHFQELTEDEMLAIDGGIWKFVRDYIIGKAIDWVLENSGPAPGFRAPAGGWQVPACDNA